MKLGRPRRLKLPQIQVHKVDLLRRVFTGHDQEAGDYWNIFSRGTPEQIQYLCVRLAEKGLGEFQGQCDLNNPQSYVSRIIAGRTHHMFPKARRDAQIQFLARFTAVGRYVSAKTWKRSVLRQDDDSLSSPELNFTPKIEWTEETD